jgi:hypothetical protein
VEYNTIQIKLKNIPRLEKLVNGNCCRTYTYCFNKKLPEQNSIDQIAGSLEQKFKFSKDEFEIPEDIEICASIIIKRVEDYQAQVSILTDQPEESCVYIFGSFSLPRKLEAILGNVMSIQGQSREIWVLEQDL